MRFCDALRSQSFHSLLDNTRLESTRLCLGDLGLGCATQGSTNSRKNAPGTSWHPVWKVPALQNLQTMAPVISSVLAPDGSSGPSFPLKSPHDGLHIRTRRKWGLGSFTLSNVHLEGTMMYQKQHDSFDSCSFEKHPIQIIQEFQIFLASCYRRVRPCRAAFVFVPGDFAVHRLPLALGCFDANGAWATQCATQRGAKSWRQWEKGAHRVCTPEGLLSEYCSIMFDSSSGPHRVGWVRVREVLEFHPVEFSSSSSSGLSLDGVWARVRVVMPKGVESEVKFGWVKTFHESNLPKKQRVPMFFNVIST